MFSVRLKRVAAANAAIAAASMAYLKSKSTVTAPLPADDPIWTSKAYDLVNPTRKPSLNDLVSQRIRASSVRPELLENQEKLTQELCRGIWSGFAYTPQRLLLTAVSQDATTSAQLWEVEKLESADYKAGTKITNMFEVLSTSPDHVLLRLMGKEDAQGVRDLDGLIEISTRIIGSENDEGSSNAEIEVSFKSCFLGASGRVESWLHFWYARALLETGSWKILS